MECSFDIRGYLKPAGKNKISEEDFLENFIHPFEEGSSRKELYDGFVRYNSGLKSLLSDQKYFQWIDGSFISTKVNPRDIDLVNLIDYQLVDAHEAELKRFINESGKREYGIDGYIVKVYPIDHRYYVRTKLTLAYWSDWFSTSRKNRRKQRFPKGFVEIEY